MKILLDLDEVLADFVGGACKAFNVPIEEITKLTTNSAWGSLVPAIGKVKGFNLTEEFFWAVIHQQGETFWSNLEPLPWAREVLDLVQSLTDDWHIVTSPSKCPTSYSGKVRWAKNYFGQDFDRICPYRYKYLFAGPGTLLIDDRESNVTDFIAAGGNSILFPRHHNSLHMLSHDPVKHLRRMLLPTIIGADDALEISGSERRLQGISGGNPYGYDPDQAV